MKSSPGGFSLVELMISIAIIAVISAVVVYNHRRFDNDINLTTFAYDAALNVRQAQVFGLSVRVSPGTTPDPFGVAYGVWFNEATPGSYIFFADKNDNKVYDSSGGEALETINATKGNTISDVCGIRRSDNTEDCSVTSVSISFKRPKPEAILYYNGLPNPSFLGVRLNFGSPAGTVRSVVVQETGQISTEN